MTTQSESRWQDVLAEIRKSLRKQQYDTWFRQVQFTSAGGENILLIVPNRFCADWLARNYLATVEEAVKRVLGFSPTVEFKVDSSPQADLDRRVPERAGVSASLRLGASSRFENFVVGSSNRLAQAAARGVAESPGAIYNPLFIRGGTGTGKTHLLQSLCHRFMEFHPGDTPAYVPARDFVAEVVSARGPQALQRLQSRYSRVSLFVLDDVHHLADKRSSQEAFFHIFNELHSQKRQLVVSGDRLPQEIEGLSRRLVSRLRWGLLVGIDNPDEEMKVAILRKKAAKLKLNVGDAVLRRVASHAGSSIRELEGALVRLWGHASLSGQPMTATLARQVLSEAASRRTPAIDVGQIQRAVAKHFGLKVPELISKNRSRAVAFPRQIGMYLTRSLTNMSLGEIGKRFGGRDHTTVLYACEKMTREKQRDETLVDALRDITTALRNSQEQDAMS